MNASYKIFDRGNDSIAAEEGDEAVVAEAETLIDARLETTDHHPGGAAETVSVNLRRGESLIPMFRQGLVEVVGLRGRSAALLPGRRLRRGPRRGDVVGQLAAPRLRSEEIAEGQGDAVHPGLLVAAIRRGRGRARARPSGTEGGARFPPAVRRARARRLPVAIGESLHIRDRGRGRGRGHCPGGRMIDGENLMQEHKRKRHRLILERPAPVITAA